MQPEDVVRAELNAWHGLDVDEIVSHFHPGAVGTTSRWASTTGTTRFADLSRATSGAWNLLSWSSTTFLSSCRVIDPWAGKKVSRDNLF